MKFLSIVIVIGGMIFGGALLGQTTNQDQKNQGPHGTLRWDCKDCHTTASWLELRSPMNFDHNDTGFHLTGGHRTAPCIGCHQDLIFNHVGAACVDCHSDHHNGQLGLDCGSCHTPRDWQNRKDMLELHAERGFPLAGVHAVADCEACHPEHVKQQYAGTPTDCYGCHADAYLATVEPNHALAGFSHDCETCHNAALGNWRVSNYVHSAAFPLTGSHKQAVCSQCHASGFKGTSTVCYDCHSAAFAAATDPNHEQMGVGHECAVCHSTIAWRPARYDHNATAFPLTGKHTTVTCVSCHPTTYAGTPTDCYACHRAAYEATTDPNHIAAGFPTTCEGCHSTADWTGATFDHNATAFPLTGKHRTVTCVSCHATTYAGTPTDCYACHRAAYEATTDPNHIAAGFPTTCEGCHSTANWTSTTWDHDGLFFPIYSGTHRGAWTACSDCHVIPSSFATFECITCHAHTQSETDAQHSEVTNYQYVSTACYTCHPRGTHE